MLKGPGLLSAAVLTGVLALAAWQSWPVYAYFAHAGDAPLPPWGWMDAEGDGPSRQELFDPRFAAAGDEVLAALAQHRREIGAPGMTAAVAVGGAIVWTGAVGWADVENRVAMTPDTIMRIGSSSKPITATALARLVQKRIMGLDTPLAEYMELPNPAWAPITPRMLASHTAGIPHYGDVRQRERFESARLSRHYATVGEALSVFDESPLLFAPGTDFEYSSLGTVLLGAVMSEASGLSYVALVTEEVLVPAGMTSTVPASAEGPEPEGMARHYVVQDGRLRPWRRVDVSHRLPGGGWASTSADLVRMGMMWLNDDLITPSTREVFWQPQAIASGEVNEQDYALGWRWREWEVEGAPLARNANHGGVGKGGQSWILVYPDLDMAIAFNMNGRTETFGAFGSFHHRIYAPFARTAAGFSASLQDGREGAGPE